MHLCLASAPAPQPWKGAGKLRAAADLRCGWHRLSLQVSAWPFKALSFTWRILLGPNSPTLPQPRKGGSGQGNPVPRGHPLFQGLLLPCCPCSSKPSGQQEGLRHKPPLAGSGREEDLAVPHNPRVLKPHNSSQSLRALGSKQFHPHPKPGRASGTRTKGQCPPGSPLLKGTWHSSSRGYGPAWSNH